MAIPTLISEISGLTTSYYNSGGVNKLYVDTISSNLNSKITILDSWSGATDFYNFSSNTRGLYFPSSETRYGWGSVSNEGTIAHTCSTKPSWVSIAPSGANPFMYSFKVDSTNITIYHSTPDSEVFSWRAVV